MSSAVTATAMPNAVPTPHNDLVVDDEKGLPSRSSRDFCENEHQQSHLVSSDSMPDWFETNPYIHHGYRTISNSTRLSFASWCYMHNETVNIFSHFIPAVLFLLGEWYIFQYLNARYDEIVLGDYLVLAFFLLSATICMGLSSSYHTLMNHSAVVESIWLRLDLIGIAVLILGSFVSGIYVGFWCEVLERKIYWSMVSELTR
jgi:adiponectin receptor